MNPHREKCSGCSERDELLAVAAAELDESTRMLRDAHARERVQIDTIKRATAQLENVDTRIPSRPYMRVPPPVNIGPPRLVGEGDTLGSWLAGLGVGVALAAAAGALVFTLARYL